MTGATGALGPVISHRLADDGFDLALNDLTSRSSELSALADEIRAKGRKTVIVVADMTIEADVQKMVEDTVEALGGLNVVRHSRFPLFCSVEETAR